jgi:hypothetical protein
MSHEPNGRVHEQATLVTRVIHTVIVIIRVVVRGERDVFVVVVVVVVASIAARTMVYVGQLVLMAKIQIAVTIGAAAQIMLL